MFPSSSSSCCCLLILLGLCCWGGRLAAADGVATEIEFGGGPGTVHSALSTEWDHALDAHWHLLTTLTNERFDFKQSLGSHPEATQSLALRLGLEYRIDEDEAAFDLEIAPGWYSGSTLRGGVFDVPVVMRGGLPVSEHWFVAGGFYYERLSRYPWLPIVGVIGEMNKEWELDLLFPESKLSYRPDEATTWSAVVELVGHGYQLPGKERLEFYETLIGLTWEHDFTKQWSVTAKGGWLMDRTFDFYQEGRTERLDSAPVLELSVRWSW